MAFPPEQASDLRASSSVPGKKYKVFPAMHLLQLDVSLAASAAPLLRGLCAVAVCWLCPQLLAISSEASRAEME